MKRIVLFVLTNLAVVVVLGIVASLLGVNRYLTANGLNLGGVARLRLHHGFWRRHHLAADFQAGRQVERRASS